MGNPQSKVRLLYLGDKGRPLDPWMEIGEGPPELFQIEAHPLLEIHKFIDTPLHAPIKFVLVDLDLVANTQPLDTWAFNAWRSSINDLISKISSPIDGAAPRLVGLTRNPNWKTAQIGVQIGARLLCDIKTLKTDLLTLLGEKNEYGSAADKYPLKSKNPFEDNSNIPKTIVKFEKRDSHKNSENLGPAQENLFPKMEHNKIPKHTIPFPIEGIDGDSKAIEGVKDLIRRAAPMDTSILIIGASGSGKELVAKSIHKHSSRHQKPFVVLHCASLNTNLIESELFGHVQGSFTDATQDRIGILQSASGGTLFLDEISAMSPELQSRLLRVLSDQKIRPVGASHSVDIDLRLISATQFSPEELVEQGRLREDLLFRLRVIEISLPKLNERKADLPAISQSFLRRLSKRMKKPLSEISDAAMEKLILYTWPGNVRELENVLEHGAMLSWSESRTQIEVDDLPESIRFIQMNKGKEHDLKEVVKRFEKEYIAATIRRLGGSKEEAAEVLGLSLATLYRKIGT